MDKKKHYLLSSPLLPSEKIGGPIVLLSKSLKFDLEEQFKLPKEYEMIPEPWQNPEEVSALYDYLEDVYFRMLKKIGARLNQIHGLKISPVFWDIPLAPWLIHFLGITYDRYFRLKRAIEIYGISEVQLLVCKGDWVLPEYILSLNTLLSNEPIPISQFYGEISIALGIPYIEFIPKIENDYFQPKTTKKNRRHLFRRLGGKLSRVLNSFLQSIDRKGNDFLLVDYKFSLRDKHNLSKNLNATFFKTPKFNCNVESVNRDILREIPAQDEFESVVVKLLPQFLPQYFLETFHAHFYTAKKFENFKIYFSANEWYSSVIFQFASSLGRMNGGKLVLCQHGGGYGIYRNMLVELIERNLSDFYVTWGWIDNKYKGGKLVPLPQPNLSRIYNKHREKSNRAIWVSAAMTKELFRFNPYPYLPCHLSLYFEFKKLFLQGLKSDVRGDLIYRQRIEYFGWSEEEKKLFLNYPEVNIESGGVLTEILVDIKLFICDHLGTSFLEAFACNTPTILFWENDPNLERETSSEWFESLRKTGILFHDPIEASKAVNEIWHDVSGWWYDPKRQEIREKFVDQYCRADPNFIGYWIKGFQGILNS